MATKIIFYQCQITFCYMKYYFFQTEELNTNYSLIIDGLFGFSFKPPVRPDFRPTLLRLCETTTPVVSIDIPSGWNVETGPGETAEESLRYWILKANGLNLKLRYASLQAIHVNKSHSTKTLRFEIYRKLSLFGRKIRSKSYGGEIWHASTKIPRAWFVC